MDQLQELTNQLTSGEITQEEYDARYAELMANQDGATGGTTGDTTGADAAYGDITLDPTKSEVAAGQMAQAALTDPSLLATEATPTTVSEADETSGILGEDQLEGTDLEDYNKIRATALSGPALAEVPGGPGLTPEEYAQMALRFAVGADPSDPDIIARFDADGDGRISAQDSLAILKGEYTVKPLATEGDMYQTYDATQVSEALDPTTAAEGTVSDEAQIDAAQIDDLTYLADAAGMPEDRIKEIIAGTREVTPEELPALALALNIPEVDVPDALKGMDYAIDAAEKGVQEGELVDPEVNATLPPAESATLNTTAVNEAAKVSEYPTAEAAQSGFESTIEGAQGTIGANELVDAKDIVKTEEAIQATAATLDALDEAHHMEAVQGSFSEGVLARAEQGDLTARSTVQGQMSELMQQFNDGTPSWAAGAMRAANAAMVARGLGGSSMAAAAIVQATMESALPLAVEDARAFRDMEMQNLANRQQVALANAAAQQNLELKNLDFRQQAALNRSTQEFERQMTNLSNEQAVVIANAQLAAGFQGQVLSINSQTALANAAKYAEMNNINLNNRQQAMLSKSAQNLEVEMANLSNEQQSALSNLQVRAALIGQELTNEQQMAMLESTNAFTAAQFDATAKQEAFMQDAAARLALKGQTLTLSQQRTLFNASRIAEVNDINLTNEQQTRIFNMTNKLTVDTADLSNRQAAALANAQIEASIRGQELNNRQQVAIITSERFAEANNITFTAEQQAELYNSQMMQTIGLSEMSATNAATLQNAANYARMDIANLDARQQALVENAKTFLQMDMANLSNEQQSLMFDAQAKVQALLSDQAADNAAKQFNAANETQAAQFMQNLYTQVSQFNATQRNTMDMFEAGEANAISKFNAELENQRDQFEAANALVIAQANAQWRQNIVMSEFAADAESNMELAKTINGLTASSLDQLWQRERDLMEFSWSSSEKASDRVTSLLLGEKTLEGIRENLEYKEDAAKSQFIFEALTGLAKGLLE